MDKSAKLGILGEKDKIQNTVSFSKQHHTSTLAYMELDYSAIITGAVSFGVCLMLRLLLDFELAQWIVKYLSWLPVRNIFRAKPARLLGLWEQSWDVDSTSFPTPTDRHSNVMLRQLGAYCYGEFTAKQTRYCIFGKVEGQFMIGSWYDADDKLGYFGTFQLRILNSKTLEGRWLGHSATSNAIKHGDWIWKKVN